uniref:Uncharacterized protein n=1 Tax=Timema monikensis TaxID=170555 RepID=A0A7R9EFP4_9NEOP|nr:unnamed protein product [Timema monikensis]
MKSKYCSSRDEMLSDYKTLTTIKPEEETVNGILSVPKSHCIPKTNDTILAFNFFNRKQCLDKPFENFYAEIRALATPCEFGDQDDKLLRAQIILGVNSQSIKHLLRDDTTLHKVVEYCKSVELADKNLKTIKDGRGSSQSDIFKGSGYSGVQDIEVPAPRKDLQRISGTVNYLRPFVPHLHFGNDISCEDHDRVRSFGDMGELEGLKLTPPSPPNNKPEDTIASTSQSPNSETNTVPLGTSLPNIVTSSFDYERNDEQICGTPLRYFMTKTLRNKMGPKLSKLKELECRTFPGVNSLENVKEPEKLNIPGGGFTKLLYQKCILKDAALIILLKFCSEGDNIPDAVMLADYVDEWLDIVPKENNLPFTWSYPPSWKHLFVACVFRLLAALVAQNVAQGTSLEIVNSSYPQCVTCVVGGERRQP